MKMRASGSSYNDYLNASEGDVFITQDLEQIKLDVAQGRTDAECMNEKVLQDAINQFFPETDVWRSKLTDVLTAYVRRNHSPGYCQGTNLIAAFILLHLDDEAVNRVRCCNMALAGAAV